MQQPESGLGCSRRASHSRPSSCECSPGDPRFDHIRSDVSIQAFLTGGGHRSHRRFDDPARTAIQVPWQTAVLAGALAWLFVVERRASAVSMLASAAGLVVPIAGGSL
jgi:hypothetical protein